MGCRLYLKECCKWTAQEAHSDNRHTQKAQVGLADKQNLYAQCPGMLWAAGNHRMLAGRRAPLLMA